MLPVNGSQFDPRLLDVYMDGRDALGTAEWFDAHTHIGQNDPDGRKATAEEIIGGLDAARHQRALVFAMHEPDGYAAANDAVLEASAASGGRLLPLARVAPNADGALAEARRCLRAGAVGFKLHPRSDAFALPHPVVEEVVALAHEHRAPVLFHAGRGIPHLGDAVVDLARRYPDARLILAHAGISDLGWIAADAAALENLYFDTAWWNVADQLQLYATIPPGRILYASDMPYGPGLFAAFCFLRVARAVGHGPAVLRAIAGGQLARLVAREAPLDLGPPPGVDVVGRRVLRRRPAGGLPSVRPVGAHRAGAPGVPDRS
jgi:predicted TIM-barrel fold metal-dependent hydrolase